MPLRSRCRPSPRRWRHRAVRRRRTPAGPRPATQRRPSPATHRASSAPTRPGRLRRDHRLQQLLRVRHRQGRSAALRRPAQDQPVDREDRRPLPQACGVRLEDLVRPGTLEERVYRLRCVEAWSMVIPWIGVPLARILKAAEPDAAATFVEFTTLAAPVRDARAATGVAAVAVHRRAAPRRGDASADDPRGRPVRQDVDEPERRADPARRAVEVRLQEHQVDRPDPLRRRAAEDRMESRESARVRLLLQRQSRGRSSRDGPRRASAACPVSAGGRRSCSTAMATRSRRCTPAWISKNN